MAVRIGYVALPFGIGSPPPPFPTVAPTRVPTVHSLPLSLAGTSFMRMDIRKAAGPPLRPPAKATAKPAHHSRHSGSKTEGVYSRDMGRGNSREGGD